MSEKLTVRGVQESIADSVHLSPVILSPQNIVPPRPVVWCVVRRFPGSDLYFRDTDHAPVCGVRDGGRGGGGVTREGE